MNLRGVMLATTLLALQAGATTAVADTFRVRTTGDLLAVCDPAEPGDAAATAFCDGFVVGNGQLYREMRKAGAIREPWACADPIPSITRIRSAFVTWARANPDLRESRAVDGFWRAMTATWPC